MRTLKLTGLWALVAMVFIVLAMAIDADLSQWAYVPVQFYRTVMSALNR